MRYKLYRRLTLIAFVIAGLLQLTGDVFIENSLTINVSKVVLLVLGVVCGFIYLDNKPKRTESAREPKQ